MNKAYIADYLEKNLSEKRRRHIEGVRTTAIELAKRFGADVEKAETAALYHDMFKERDLDGLVRELGLPDRYLGNRNLAHSKVAAAVMERDLGFTDRDILNAVSFHTTGRSGMSKLEQIIFLADAIEPGRDYPSVDLIRDAAREDLDKACYLCLSRSVDYVRSKGEFLDEDTLKAKLFYEERISKNNMESRELALEALKLLDQKQGKDIKAIDVAEKSSFADYLVIASGGSERQAMALADDIEDRFAELGFLPKGTEGKQHTGWILIDYGDVIVNIFTQDMRDRYNIEDVWGDCEVIVPEEK